MRKLTMRGHAVALVVMAIAWPHVMVVGNAEPADQSQSLTIEVLGNRADLVSGGTALVTVAVPPRPLPSSLQVTVGDTDLTPQFREWTNGRFVGLIAGLATGRNEVTARANGFAPASLTITNHPRSGPVFSGPQFAHWKCDGAVVDPCDPPVDYDFFFLGLDRQFHSFDPSNPPPPSSVAETTTDHGVSAPFIVRVETGYVNRDQYKIGVLYDPQAEWTAWAPQRQWNHKLLILDGDGCGVEYGAGRASDVLDQLALGRGFAVMSSAANDSSHNCNLVLQAEALVMAKEHLVETYGQIRYTIGSGCSGGAIAQLQVANAYPGIYQGLLPNCTIPDAWTLAVQWEDFALLRRYFEDPTKWEPGVTWSPSEIGAVAGQPNHGNAVVATTAIPGLLNPATRCPGLEESQRWSAANPAGVRCSLQDFMVNVFGRRPVDGSAARPFDNVGIQFGLQAVLSGAITPAQFVDLNTKIGSHDIDYVWQNSRVAADRDALDHAYRSGAVNAANNLGRVAIIDLRGPDTAVIHDAFWSMALRERLERENGSHANHVLWRGLMPTIGDFHHPWANDFGQAPVEQPNEALKAIDRWLAAVEADVRDVDLPTKIIENRPPDVADRCTNGTGLVLPDSTACDAAMPVLQNPRMVAGQPLTADVLACGRKPIVRADYAPVAFSDQEWDKLQSVFAGGVCDYSSPGIGQASTRAWQTYADGPGLGRPMGPPPASTRGADAHAGSN